jgi:DNA-binding NarL/FixJ family response regulator
MNPTRILLADDHALVRAGFRALLHELGMQVVAEANNGSEALQLIELHQPDIVLMDIVMPELNGLEATARVVEAFPDVRVIILSMYVNVEYVRRAMRAGAAGYLLKNAKAAELQAAIHAVTQGEAYLSPAVAKFIVADYAAPGSGDNKSAMKLTPRQIEILQLLAKGYSRKQIAEKLVISVKTFDTYRAQLIQQLDVQDAAGLVRVATQMGLISPDE